MSSLVEDRQRAAPGTRAPSGAAGRERPSVSVVIITRGRLELLKSCLASLEAAAPPRPREAVVIVNGPDPETRGWLASRRPGPVPLRWRELSRPSKGRARNAGVRLAHGDWVHFCDDDVTLDPGLYAAAARRFEALPGADVIGGPNRTPEASTPFQKSAGFALESWWGAGPMRRRYRPVGGDVPADDRGLMVCNLFVRRRLFGETGVWFNESFFYNEENVLLENFRKKGAALFYSSALSVRHVRRNGWKAYLRQVWHSGVGRGHMTRAMPSSLRPAFLAPAAWAAYLAALPWLGPLGSLPAAAYALVTLAEGLRHARESGGGPRAAARAAALIAAGHLSYAAGFFAGLFVSSLNAPPARAR